MRREGHSDHGVELQRNSLMKREPGSRNRSV